MQISHIFLVQVIAAGCHFKDPVALRRTVSRVLPILFSLMSLYNIIFEMSIGYKIFIV